MGVDFFMENSLQPLETQEPFQATAQNLNAALNNGKLWIMVTARDGELALIHIPKLLYIKQNRMTED